MDSNLLNSDCDISTKEIKVLDELLEMIKSTYNVEYMSAPVDRISGWNNVIAEATTYKLQGQTSIELFREFSRYIDTDYIAIYKFGIIKTIDRNYFTVRLAKCPNIIIGNFNFTKELFDALISIIPEIDLKNFINSSFNSVTLIKNDIIEYTITKNRDNTLQVNEVIMKGKE